MNGPLRIVLLALICLSITSLLLLLFNALIYATAPCYFANGCRQTPIIGTIGYFFDVLGHVFYFSIFPLGAVVRKNDFRKLKKSRGVTKTLRIIFAAIPVFLFPLKYLVNIAPF